MESGRKILGTSKNSSGRKSIGQAKNLVEQNSPGTRTGNVSINLSAPTKQNISWVQLDQKQLRTLVKMSAMSRRWLQGCLVNDPSVAGSVKKDIAEINSIDKILLESMALERLNNDYGYMSN